MYLEGFEEEGIIESTTGSGDPTVVAEEAHHHGGTTVVDRQHRKVFSGQPGEMAAFGIPEKTIPR